MSTITYSIQCRTIAPMEARLVLDSCPVHVHAMHHRWFSGRLLAWVRFQANADRSEEINSPEKQSSKRGFTPTAKANGPAWKDRLQSSME